MFECFIRSTVLGGEVVAEVKGDGSKARRYVFAGGAKFAELTERYTFSPSATHDSVQYYHTDPLGVSQRVTRNSPETVLGTTSSEPDYIDPRHAEYDAMGSNTGLKPNVTIQYLPSEPPLGMETDTNFINGQIVDVYVDGMRMPNAMAANLVRSEGVTRCPNDQCITTTTNSHGQTVFAFFQVHADGSTGYRVPVWSNNQVWDEDNGLTNYPPQLEKWEWKSAKVDEFEDIDLFSKLLLIINTTLRNNPRIIRTINTNFTGILANEVAVCHAAIESSLDPDAKGALGEIGLFQLRPRTARELFALFGQGAYSDKKVYDPALNTKMGTHYLNTLYLQFDRNLELALGAYKQGATSVTKIGLTPASQQYATAVNKCADHYIASRALDR